ncbi:MAG: S8 family serine peptidase [Methanosarcinaceae archaeon]|nr:S8 family serine peptidase [Methanosarcinaceae archaeon]
MGKISSFVVVVIVTFLLISISTGNIPMNNNMSSASDLQNMNRSYQGSFHEDVLLPSKYVVPTTEGINKHSILMRSIQIDTCIEDILPEMSHVAINDKQSNTSYYYIVQFEDHIQDEWKYSLSDAGAEIINYLPINAYLVRMSPLLLDTVKMLDHVHWVGVYRPEYKIDPDLLPSGSGQRDITVLLFEPEQDRVVSQMIDALGGRVLDRSPCVIRANIDMSKVADISVLDGVRWIEEYTKPVIQNNVASVIMNATIIHSTHNLNGSGQVIGIADTGLDTSHPDFQGRIDALLDLSDNGPEDVYSGHGTHVSGSVLGNGSASNGSFAGIAPEAHLVFQAIEDADESLGGIPANLTVLFQQAYNNGSRIHTNSWGSSSYGVYNSYSQNVDLFMWEHPDMLILFSAGNDGVDFDSNGVVDLDSTGAPATAKNCLTVGASENYRPGISNTYGGSWPSNFPVDPIYSDRLSDNIKGMAAFSSRGPTDDGRTKPDVVAPGTFIISARSSNANGTGWGVYDQSYLYMGGTSMATPLTAGAAALVRQNYMDNMNITPSAALIKATMIHGAHDMYPGEYDLNDDVTHVPDHSQGWGRVDLEETLYPSNSRSIHYSDNTSQLTTGDSVEARYYVTNSSQPFRATLVWTDYPSDVGAQINLVNDLDLLVTGPTDNEYGLNDSINNVEQFEISISDIGWYTMTISGTSIPHGPQPFATVVSGIINDPILTSINITNKNVYVHDTCNFTAHTLDQISNPINATVLWNCSNTTVGTINMSTGVFTALDVGTATVTAVNGSVSGNATMEVLAEPVLSTINITTSIPDPLIDGQTLNFTADTFDQYNNTFNTT